MLLSLGFLYLVAGSSLPDWVDALKPEAKLGLRYLKRFEENRDLADFELNARFGIFPEPEPDFQLGIELGTFDRDTRSRENVVRFGDQSKAKTIGLSQAFLAWQQHWSTHWVSNLAGGKFIFPFSGNPILWRKDRYPEGAYESFVFSADSGRFFLKLHAGQFTVDRVQGSLSSNTSFQRSWLFIQGFEIHRSLTERTKIEIAGNSFLFKEASDQIQIDSSDRGNNLTINSSGETRLTEKFYPAELFTKLSTNQFGLSIEMSGGAAINFNSRDNERAFIASASMGNSWKKRKAKGNLSYFYTEPNVQLASFTDPVWGETNRQGGRFQLDYYITNNIRTGASFLYANTLEKNFRQAHRRDIFMETEWIF